MKSTTLNRIAVLTGLTLGAFALSVAAANFSAPLHTPPTCNTGEPGCDAPINVGPTLQTKLGWVGLKGLITEEMTFANFPGGVHPNPGQAMIAVDSTGKVGWGSPDGSTSLRKGTVNIGNWIEMTNPGVFTNSPNLYEASASVLLVPPMSNTSYSVFLQPHQLLSYRGDSGDEAVGYIITNKSTGAFSIHAYSTSALNQLGINDRHVFDPVTKNTVNTVDVDYLIVP